MITPRPRQLIALARRWRNENPKHHGGVVLIFAGKVYGWKNLLRDPSDERPGVFAVDADEHIFVAEGGDEYAGAKCWVAHK